MVIDNNEKYADVPEYQIEVDVTFDDETGINSFSIKNNDSSQYNDFMKNVDGDSEDYAGMKKNSTYTWINAEYNGTNGRISKIELKGKR